MALKRLYFDEVASDIQKAVNEHNGKRDSSFKMEYDSLEARIGVRAYYSHQKDYGIDVFGKVTMYPPQGNLVVTNVVDASSGKTLFSHEMFMQELAEKLAERYDVIYVTADRHDPVHHGWEDL